MRTHRQHNTDVTNDIDGCKTMNQQLRRYCPSRFTVSLRDGLFRAKRISVAAI